MKAIQTHTINFKHGEGSRISKKILTALREEKAAFSVSKRSLNSCIHVPMTEEKPLEMMRNEIISLIPELFPVNYLFKITDAFSWELPFNYNLEFALVFGSSKLLFYSKIKEMRPRSVRVDNYTIEVLQ